MVRYNRRQLRRSFTLLELLVVVGIILALVSLSAVAVLKTLGYQQRRNTETLISKLDQAFKKQWLRVIDMAKTEQPNSTEMAMANNDSRYAQVIHVKLRLMQMFPTSFAEALKGPAPLGPNRAYVSALQTIQTGRTWQDESSACLYLILKQSVRGGDFDPDTGLSSQEVRAPLSDGIKEIYDSWGNPIVFARWPGFSPGNYPTAQAPPQPPWNDARKLLALQNPSGNPQGFPPSVDPVDPEGLLASTTWQNTMNATLGMTCGQYYATNVHLLAPNATYNLTPLIISMGQDGALIAWPAANPTGQYYTGLYYPGAVDPITNKPLPNNDIYNTQLTP
jgi:hypothetical protein